MPEKITAVFTPHQWAALMVLIASALDRAAYDDRTASAAREVEAALAETIARLLMDTRPGDSRVSPGATGELPSE